jgi:phosphoserine phosphatase
MPSVATFISAPGFAALDNGILEQAARSLPGAQDAVWLDANIAADLFFDGPATVEITDKLRTGLAGRPVDVVVQPLDHRRKKLLLADMDSTMIEQECLDELADFAGLRGRIAPVTARAMRGDISFVPALRERIALLKGLDADAIDDVITHRVTETAGARTLVATMRAHGAFTVLVSGGFTAFTEKIAAMIGFDDHVANVLGVTDGKLNGLIDEPILDRAGKHDILEAFCRKLGIPVEAAIAVGDGANDLDMLEGAGLGVAFHAKPLVAAAARARIDHGDLSALLYLQGYGRDEFVY